MIRKITKKDKELYVKFSEEFNQTDAVLEPIPLNNHLETFEELMRSKNYLEGYIIEHESRPVGYALVTKTFAHDAGGKVLWVDELYIQKEYRSKGLGKEFFTLILSRMGEDIKRIRLEVNPKNHHAARLYKRLGFKELDYNQMYIEN